MQNQRLTIVGVVLGIALFLAVNLLAGPTLRGVRADLTEQKLYTISQGTRNIVGGLEEDITLRYFFTRKLAQEEAEAPELRRAPSEDPRASEPSVPYPSSEVRQPLPQEPLRASPPEQEDLLPQVSRPSSEVCPLASGSAPA